MHCSVNLQLFTRCDVQGLVHVAWTKCVVHGGMVHNGMLFGAWWHGVWCMHVTMMVYGVYGAQWYGMVHVSMVDAMHVSMVV